MLLPKLVLVAFSVPLPHGSLQTYHHTAGSHCLGRVLHTGLLHVNGSFRSIDTVSLQPTFSHSRSASPLISLSAMACNRPAKGKSRTRLPGSKRSVSPFFSYETAPPYWSTDDRASIPDQSEEYQQALTYFSASHPPVVDRTYVSSVIANAPESSPHSLEEFSITIGGQSRVQTTIFEYVTGSKITTDTEILFPLEVLRDSAPGIGRAYRVIYRVLPGGGLCQVYVGISAHKRVGHTSAVKLGPGIGLNHRTVPIRDRHDGRPKVRPLAYIAPFEYPDHTLSSLESSQDMRDPILLSDENNIRLGKNPPEVVLSPPPEAKPLEDTEVEPDAVIFRNSISTGASPSRLGRQTSSDSLVAGNAVSSGSLDGCEQYSSGLSLRCLAGARHSGHNRISKADITVIEHKTVTWSSPKEQATIHEVKPQRVTDTRRASELIACWESMEYGKQDSLLNKPGSHGVNVLQPQKAGTVRDEPRAHRSRDPEPETMKHYSRLRWTASWFRGLVEPPEPYKTDLTGFPGKRSNCEGSTEADVNDELGGPALPWKLTRISLAPATPIDSKFKDTLEIYNHILNEAMILTEECVVQKEYHSIGRFEVDQTERQGTSNRPPSVHESLSSIHEPGDDERPLRRFHGRSALKDVKDPGASAARTPKHYSSAPGLHSRNVMVDILGRASSTTRSKLHVAIPGSPRKRSHEKRLSTKASEHRLRKERSVSVLQQHGEKPESDSPPPSGCLPRVMKSKKLRYQRSLNSMKRSRSRHGTSPEVDGPLDDEFQNQGLTESCIGGTSLEFRFWGCDGVNDETVEGLLDNHLHQGAHGAVKQGGIPPSVSPSING